MSSKICENPNCKKEILLKGHSVKYCSISCRNEVYFKNKQESLKKGIENIDYVVDLWTGNLTPRIYGKYISIYHPEKTIEDYKKEFPNAPIQCKKISAKNGQFMKEDIHRKRQSQKMTGEGNLNHKSKTTEEQRKSKSPFSKDFRKYKSEEDRNEFIKKIDYDSRLLPSNIQYWINKGFSKSESEEKVKERQNTFTIEKCIKKYGEVEGNRIFKERQDKWKEKLNKSFYENGDGRSPQSKFANEIKESICNILNIEVPKKEKWICSQDGKLRCSYDFTYGKKIIEFNGDFWHMNPVKYKSDYFNKRTNKTAQQKWKEDKEKIDLAKNNGYQVLIIWETDYVRDKNKVIDLCLQYLKQD